MTQKIKLQCLPQVKETTRDIKFLHNEMFFAAAQKKYVYIYDKRGVEIHCLRVSALTSLYSSSDHSQAGFSVEK